MSILQKLTEGVVSRDMRKEGAALLNKWEQTGLLEGLGNDVDKNNMARLLENQAKQLLKEAASSMAGGDVEGFAAVAFPIVRRVFGGLIANDLVSVQPMSLPSGLIFFLDFTHGDTKLGFAKADSLYGGGVVGQQITGGVNLDEEAGTAAGQFYNLTNGVSAPTGSDAIETAEIVLSGAITQGGQCGPDLTDGFPVHTAAQVSSLLRYDPDLVSGSVFVMVEKDMSTGLTAGDVFDYDNLAAVAASGVEIAGNTSGFLVRRLTHLSRSADGQTTDQKKVRYIFVSTGSNAQINAGAASQDEILEDLKTAVDAGTLEFPLKDNFAAVEAQAGAVTGLDNWGLEGTTAIPEINLKVDSVSVTAITKKLKAKWTPELGQDLNAYHNLDAEVELTSILSEQIALEIDREIVEDLVKGAKGATYYWSRSPGLFVNKETGEEVGANSAAPDFTGTVSEWYETLGETINDVSAQIHRKTLRGGANFLVTSPEVANILEFTAGFRANVTHDDEQGAAGTTQVGTLSKRYDVYVDPYFPRNLILVGRRGGSFLESGYVYAPYVPLQVTPTIFGIEDFVPRKGVMTRYAKKMVRPDMYGLVICRGLLGESGA